MVRDFLAGVSHDAWTSIMAWPLWKKLIVGFCCAAAILIVSTTDLDIAMLRSWADQAGSWFPIVFFCVYVTITQFPIPRTILTVSAGVFFGSFLGIVLAVSATAVAAAVSFVIVRKLLGEWIRPHLRHPAVAHIDTRLRQRGWLTVFSLRMIAGVPFSLLNYVAALTSIRFVPFVVATAIGSTPGTVATVVFGAALAGDSHPYALIFALVFAVFGVTGLALDSRLPVQNIKHTR